jgi:L-lactate utilization protein LutB
MIDSNKKWLYQKWAKQVIKNLKNNCIEGFYFDSSKEALPRILEHIPQGATVGLGDSMTLKQIGMISILEKGGYHLLNPWAEPNQEKKVLMQRQILTSDVFLVGTNAITLNGELINVDGRGNRVAAMIFGPKKVLIVVGVNKIVRDIEEGINRIKFIAAPANAKRHEFPKDSCPPCAVSGFCSGCKPPLTICCFQVVIRGQRLDRDRIKVFIVGEELGL